MPPADKYTAPGVFIEESSSFRPEIPMLHSTVPAFIGSAASGQFSLLPKKINSLLEYTSVFGEDGQLLPHLQLYFDNGGGECFVINAETGEFTQALDVLTSIPEPTLLVIPQLTSLGKQDYIMLVRAMLHHCAAAANRFAILDVYAAGVYNTTIIQEHRDDVGSENLRYGASYFPFVIAAGGGQVMPASAAIAGIYCRMDRDRGIWKSPANMVINGITAPSVAIDAQQQDFLNIDPVSGKSINAIRKFEGRGTLIWGARTLAGNDNEWRYVAVQRFCSWIKACVQKGLEPFAFEENNSATWVKVRAITENFLVNLWRQGALAGAKTDEAFYVRAGIGQTMTQQDINEGRLIVEIGVATSRPAEFIILRIIQLLAR